MDNASSHRNKKIRKLITAMKHEYLYILPYKHYLNSIENYFNHTQFMMFFEEKHHNTGVKYYIKQKTPMNYDKIKSAINFAIKYITKTHYQNYFYNAYDKNKLKNKYKNTYRLRKHPKTYKN